MMKNYLIALVVLVLVYLIYNSVKTKEYFGVSKNEICHPDNRLLVVVPGTLPYEKGRYVPVTQNREGIHYPTELNPAYAKKYKVPKLKYDGIFSRHCDMKGVDMEKCVWSL